MAFIESIPKQSLDPSGPRGSAGNVHRFCKEMLQWLSLLVVRFFSPLFGS
jgi:hypothetical protein